MKHLELHVIQSFPVSCLNRDDLNSPKTAFFGGSQRARVSSQCWKRAVRETAGQYSNAFQGQRSILIHQKLRQALMEEAAKSGVPIQETTANENAQKLIEQFSKLDSKKSKSDGQVVATTLFYTSPQEIKAMAKAFLETQDSKKAVKKLRKEDLMDAADVLLFGRMSANDPSLNIESCTMFSHAISTHRVENEIDFFTALDDFQDKNVTGSAMMGSLEFNSATYYRFAALDLDLFADEDHFSFLGETERRELIGHFVKAVLEAVPGAKKNSMNANTRPSYVLGLIRDSGHPIQLANAFEQPVKPGREGLDKESIKELQEHFAKMNETWGLEYTAKAEIPDMNLNGFIEELTRHV